MQVPTGKLRRGETPLRVHINTGFQELPESAILTTAPWWWWKAQPLAFETETTMLIIGVVLGFVGLGFLCWLLFALAVYALPFFAAVTMALAAHDSGSGSIGAILVGLIAGVVTIGVGQIAYAVVRSPLFRAAIALLFAAPAALVGYHATLGLVRIAGPFDGWQEAFATLVAAVVGGTAWARMRLHAPSDVGQGVAPGPTQSPFGLRMRDQMRM